MKTQLFKYKSPVVEVTIADVRPLMAGLVGMGPAVGIPVIAGM